LDEGKKRRDDTGALPKLADNAQMFWLIPHEVLLGCDTSSHRFSEKNGRLMS